ncbi:hypothetical protein, partial [Nocardia cyriacigeorgica]|uniref:hypothetical protein n=1 Tax=Nocardia cyriacigeorgica TaxID=135487 RepID=UPI002B4AEEDA
MPATRRPSALMVQADSAAPRERMVNRWVDSSTVNSTTGAAPSAMISGATKRTSSTATVAAS